MLSRFAGAASYFKDALIVTPYDPDEIADAIRAALNMPAEERRRRHANLLEPLRELTAANYCKAFLRELSVPVAQHSLLMSAE